MTQPQELRTHTRTVGTREEPKKWNVSINEHLTTHSTDMARKVWYLRTWEKTQHTWTTNGQASIKLNEEV